MPLALQNTGGTDLVFTTVEPVTGSTIQPLPVPESVRLKSAAAA